MSRIAGISRRTRGPIAAILTIATVSLIATPRLFAQVQIRDFTRPFVALNTGGHSAPVRSLIFTPDGEHLLSAGMDKVILDWSLQDGRGTIARTIRPPIWRGPAGIIYAMSLSPVADAGGQRLLAVAGYGLWSTRGNITLYRYPGRPDRPFGEFAGQILGHIQSDPNSPGHADTVNALAFSPDGATLASCGNDGRVILWDVKTLQARPLSGPGRPVLTLAFRPDGLRLASGGVDGVVRLHDVTTRALIAQKEPTAAERPGPTAAPDPEGDTILCLGFRPSSASLVIGRENGLLVRYEGDTLDTPTILQPVAERFGPIEALAFSHDGKTLATSVVRHKLKTHGERPRVESEIGLRTPPDAATVTRRFAADNLVYSLAFSPDDKRLAYAGGNTQEILVHDLTRPDRPALGLRGQGKSVWRVGFAPEGRVVAFSRERKDDAGADGEFLAFDLQTQTLPAEPPKILDRAITTLNGWSVTPEDPLKLTLNGPGGKKVTLALDPIRDRRWWSYSFFPASATHPRPTIGVACDGGVAVFRVEDGVRTRSFSGHSGAVYDLAPSRDGRWLATGSADQTVRIWSLAGCDTRPPLGATFRVDPQGRTVVDSVVPRGFAQAMGLNKGDTIEILAIEGKRRDGPIRSEILDDVPPGVNIEVMVRRGAEQIPFGTTRRDSPRVSLFVGEDREWVEWSPEGYYETSAAGDRKYLGWHRNGATLDRPTDHFSAEKFEREFRRPNVLSALIANDDPARAFALLANPDEDPAAIVQRQAPPSVSLSVPGAVVAAEAPVVAPAAGLTVQARIEAEGRSPITSARVLVDGVPTGPPTVFNPPRPTAEVALPVPVHPGEQKVVIEATNRDGKTRLEAIDVVSKQAIEHAPTLHVIAIGAPGPFPDAKFPPIPFADEDARDLRAFLAAPGGKPRYDQVADRPAILGSRATGKTLRQTFQALATAPLTANDAVVVLLESHVLIGARDRFVIASDTPSSPGSGDTPTAEEIGDALAKVAARGCKVLLLLDTSHEKAPPECRTGLTEFVRSLSRRNVIVFVAANHGASRRVPGHGAFAQAILETFSARAQSRPWVDPSRPISLDDFQDAVVARVKELTNRRQYASCYIPETLSPRLLIFEPNRPSSLVEAK